MKLTFKKIKSIFFGAFMVMLLILAALIIISRVSGETLSFFGNRYYVVSSGSMTGTIEIGEVILVEDVEFEDLAVGDIITYKSNVVTGKNDFITHRIIEIGEDYVITKGDKPGLSADAPISPDKIVGRMKRPSPILTFVFNIFQNKVGFFLVIILPIFILLIFELLDLIRNYYAYADEKKAKEAEAAAAAAAEGGASLPNTKDDA